MREEKLFNFFKCNICLKKEKMYIYRNEKKNSLKKKRKEKKKKNLNKFVICRNKIF